MVTAVVDDATPTMASQQAQGTVSNAEEKDTTLSLPVQSDSSSEEDDESVDESAAKSRNDGHQVTTTRSVVTSFDIETSSPTKRRRVHSAGRWDGFVRRGTRLKGLLGDAMQLAASSSSANVVVVDDGTTPETTVMRPEAHNHAADIAREKTRQCMILEKKLKEAEANAAAMTAANTSLRESASASTERMERTVEALRIAGTNAANARADADAAEACAASMATQLQALRDVVDETKRASQVLYKEHEQVAAGARSMEARLLQRETELARSQKEQRQWMDEKEDMNMKSTKLQDEKKSLEQEMHRLTEELHAMKHQAGEHAAVEQARKDRSAMVEKELREARTMLLEATSTAAETEATAAVLNDTFHNLENENKTLHETIEKLQVKARQDNERLQESLGKAEKEAQSLRVKAASHEEDIQRIRMDRSNSEKEVAKLKQKCVSLERRLKDASYAPSISPDDAAESQQQHGEQSTSTSRVGARGVSFSIPPLKANTPANSKPSKENRTNRVTPAASTKSATCSICSQAAVGFMKSCQCGQAGCNLRAHSSCITTANLAGPSVSHPGTPAFRSPTLLCGKK